jgi:site-specific DNA recombinase
MAPNTHSVSQRLTADARRKVKKVRSSPRRASTGDIDVGYARISEDDIKALGDAGTGVRRQKTIGNALGKREKLSPLRWFTDNDISGGDFTARAEYDALLELIATGTVRTVVAYDLDRFGREGLEQEEFMLICEVYGVRILTDAGDDLSFDRPDADDRVAMVRVKKAFAALERAKARRRTRDKMAERATAGLPHTGKRCFGFEPDMMTHRDDEVALIRQAVSDVINKGARQGNIATQWRNDGVPTVMGGVWHPEVVKQLLLSPRLIGMRSHHGELIKGTWKPIITKKEQDRVRKAFAGEPAGPKAAVAILSGGLVRCANRLDKGKVCGHPLSTGVRHRSGVRIYQCKTARGGCGGVPIDAEKLEDVVVGAFFDRLDAIYAGARGRAKTDADERGRAMAEVKAANAVLDNLADALVDGTLDRDRYNQRINKARARLKRAEVALAKFPDSTEVTALVDGREALRRDWDKRSVAVKRQALALLLDHVPVGPAIPPYNRFNQDRIGKPVWRA